MMNVSIVYKNAYNFYLSFMCVQIDFSDFCENLMSFSETNELEVSKTNF